MILASTVACVGFAKKDIGDLKDIDIVKKRCYNKV